MSNETTNSTETLYTITAGNDKGRVEDWGAGAETLERNVDLIKSVVPDWDGYVRGSLRVDENGGYADFAVYQFNDEGVEVMTIERTYYDFVVLEQPDDKNDDTDD